MVERTTNAVSYRHRSGWTKVDLRGTPLAPDATGHADVNSRPGYIEVKTEMHKLLPASQYGPEYLTYVLWAITPEGRSKNLGEVVLDGGKIAPGRDNGLAGFRAHRDRRTVLWRQPTERRGGDGKHHPARTPLGRSNRPA